MHTTAIKQEAMNIRQRAEERADRFMKFIDELKGLYSRSFRENPNFMATLNKETAARVFKQYNL